MPRSSRAGRSGGWTTRGRGYKSANWRGSQSRSYANNETEPPPRGTLLQRVGHEHLDSTRHNQIRNPAIQSCQYIASFNWLKSNSPTVVIPGMPPEWAPLGQPRKLEEDSGSYFRDINTASYPVYPIEPAVRAVLAQASDLESDEVDVFACGSTMGHLLRFACKSDKQFQFVVETIGETVFLVRRENSLDEKLQNVFGYGHTFPETYTKLDDCVRESDSHQRMIQYEFAGFLCIVRYESDGYLPSKIGSSSQAGSVRALPNLDGLKLLSGGKVIPQEATFELKTRSTRKQLTLEDVLSSEIDRLWLRQVPNFALAYHTNGVFNDIGVHDVRQQMKNWEDCHQSEITILSAALDKIVEFARSRSGQRFEVCSSTPGVLEFRLVGGDFPHALPDDLMQEWAASPQRSQVSSDDHTDELAVSSDPGNDRCSLSDGEGEEDLTACSAESCGYCGKCSY